MKLLECVPNFSEGRDADAIEQIVSAVKSCKVLDIHSDPDHNRTVCRPLASPLSRGRRRCRGIWPPS